MKAGFRDSGKILTPHREAMLLKMLGEWAKEGVQEEAEQQKEKGPCPAAEGPQEQAQEGVQEGVEQQQGQELKQRRDKAQAATHELEQVCGGRKMMWIHVVRGVCASDAVRCTLGSVCI
jgi:hypothetical protein